MSPVITAVLPLFTLIGLGAMVRRSDWIGPAAVTELNRFVVLLALPALLFSIMAKAHWSTLAQPGLATVFAVGMLGVYLPVMAWLYWRGASLTDASIDALGASYANTGFMGIPLIQLTLGATALPGVGLSVVMTACLLFALALTTIELGRQRGGGLLATACRTAWTLLKNPLIWAPLAGTIISLGGVPLPASILTTVDLLGAAASPCALVVLGMFLASPAQHETLPVASWASLSAMKLLVQPAVTWLMATALQLPGAQMHLAMLMSLLPTGTGPFMLAERYGRRAAMSSRVILATTLASLATLSVYLTVFMGD
ncbi:AEC family transporter [Stenotrophomonas tumulicola]|uniref:AEC family transporter n=1 Tax=Stenotrophomonas tumulicola TaxID=1685415 RepID=A0A7W3FNL0_9GAMM|nr:AEC family transporter [Stenotrophomonas tumulicola]MBA8682740.1 AEC family transporter [Stenotrophomonas tumulicola]